MLKTRQQGSSLRGGRVSSGFSGSGSADYNAFGSNDGDFFQADFGSESQNSGPIRSIDPDQRSRASHSGVIGSNSMSSVGSGRRVSQSFEDEPPLLEELGINFGNVWEKTRYVLIPRKELDTALLMDGDLTGPLLFAGLLGTLMLLNGKVNFGYIYGLSVCGSSGINLLLNLMSDVSIDMLHTVSILGYSMLPIVLLALAAIVVDLRQQFGLLFSLSVVCWCAAIATRFVERLAAMRRQRYLIAYPLAMFYSLFALITVF